MRKKVLFIVNHKIQFYFFRFLIEYLIVRNEVDIFLVTEDNNLQKEIKSDYPYISILGHYSPYFIKVFSPDLIICQHIWLNNISAILEFAKNSNIPILMYDHGTLIFGSYFSLEGDEYLCGYRSEMLLCSHVACWGELGKKYWLKYAAPEKKLMITGAIQYDYLYKKKSVFTSLNIYKKLKLSKKRKIIFYLSSIGHPGIDKSWNKIELKVFKNLQKFVAKNTQYALVVKPHPTTIIKTNHSFSHNKKTIFIANKFEAKWKESIVVDSNQLCSISSVVISAASSALIAPLILNIPIVYIELDNAVSKSFTKLGEKIFFNLKKGGKVAKILKKAELGLDVKKEDESQKLVKLLNYKNDGNATYRLASLIKDIIIEKSQGVQFYPSEEEELLDVMTVYPELPYSYHNLINFYAKNKQFILAEKWLVQYIEKFKQPHPIIKIFLDYYFSWPRTNPEIIKILQRYYDNHQLPTQYLIKFSRVSRELNFLELSLKSAQLAEKSINNERDKSIRKLCQYELGLLYLNFRINYKKVITLFKSAIKNNSTCVLQYRILYRLGETYFKIGSFSEAKRNLKKCILLCPAPHNKAKSILTKIKNNEKNPVNIFLL